MKTEDIIRHQRRTGQHPCGDGPDGRVSSKSSWSDEVWYLDPPGARWRQSDAVLYWNADIGTEITAALKELAWSLLVSRSSGKPMALSSTPGLSVRLRYLGGWMQRRRKPSFAALTPAAVRLYADDLVQHFSTDENGRPREVEADIDTVAPYLVVLSYIEEQAHQLSARGIATIPGAPFGDSSAKAVADRIAARLDGFIPPIPDEVVLPIVHEAHAWLRHRADDVIRLQDACMDAIDRINAQGSRWRIMQSALAGFRFTAEGPDGVPWHPSFAEAERTYDASRTARAVSREDDLPSDEAGNDGSEPEGFRGTDLVRRLVAQLVAACTIVIRFQTGVRHAEVLTFAPGLQDDGLPVCVEQEASLSGAYDLFFVKGVVSKGWDHPSDTRWLLAGRVKGDSRTPDAVRALEVLSRIGSPWRERALDPETRSSLLVQFSSKGLPNRDTQVLPMSSETLAAWMKNFISDRVDLTGLDASDERLEEYVRTRGRCVQSRQWRKTWANWVIRIDKRLLPAISQQFQHHSAALTEEAYIGKDAMQLGLVESAAMSRAVSFMRRAMAGEDHVGGNMRKIAQDDMDDLRSRLAGVSKEAFDYEIRTWLLERDVRIWFSPHGKCFIGLLPSDARCHEVAGTADWSNQVPSFSHRMPQLCSGCPCFAVDEDDLPFWTERYLENRRIWDEAVERRLEVNYVVANERWRQSEKVLRSLGVDVGRLEEEVARG